MGLEKNTTLYMDREIQPHVKDTVYSVHDSASLVVDNSWTLWWISLFLHKVVVDSINPSN